jgi:hypothetical protein
MMDEIHPFADMTDQDLESLLKRAIRITVILGGLASLALWIGSGWRNAAMMATGAAISAASIFEWRRLARFIVAKMDQKQVQRGTMVAVIFFLVRLIVFGAAIYVSLKCFRGSGVALLCGLALAVLSIVWEALRLLRE